MRIGDGQVTAIDRSATAIRLARAAGEPLIRAGRLKLLNVSAEDYELSPGEEPFDLAFAIRVGALDGRHPEAGLRAKQRIAAALRPHGRLFIDHADGVLEAPLG